MTDSKQQLLAKIHDIASKCDRCGSCLLVCPVYAVNSKEACGARGMVNAARALVKGDIAPAAAIRKSVDFCLLCGACIDVCASKVNVPEVMLKTRQLLAGLSPQDVTLSEPETAACEQAFTALCRINAGLAAEEPASGRQAAYFFCHHSRLGPLDNAVNTLKLLHAVADIELVNNEWAGLAALASGHVEQFTDSLKQNILLYQEAETIVSDCACCSDTLKKAAAYLSDDPDWRELAADFSGKIVPLSDYLTQAGYMPRPHTGTVTYHDPCHLGRLQGLKAPPRDLLKAGGAYTEMAAADSCCGGPCMFPADYPEASAALLEKKRQNIENSGATTVATECYDCLTQLQKAAAKSGGKFRAVHISEIL
ncbi:MAG: (Fe-S)-binding protein [Sporomusaceae bacterium]|nr:(Fe-S)-binding protein [Sporomusaceae bacterium]